MQFSAVIVLALSAVAAATTATGGVAAPTGNGTYTLAAPTPAFTGAASRQAIALPVVLAVAGVVAAL